MYQQAKLKAFRNSISPWCQSLTSSCESWLFLLFSGIIVHTAMSIASSPNERMIYITPTQPSNPECPQNMSCQTLQYYFDNLFPVSLDNGDQFDLAMMFLSGNYIMDYCCITRCSYYFLVITVT